MNIETLRASISSQELMEEADREARKIIYAARIKAGVLIAELDRDLAMQGLGARYSCGRSAASR